MSVPATADDLIGIIRKSGLIDETKLQAFLDNHAGDGIIRGEPRKLAATAVRDGLLTYFQAEQFLQGKWRGFTLGKYKLLERIGVGGMGQVFLCEHMHMRKRVAVKVLPPTKAEDPVALGRFYREARVASSLEHPNIVRTFDIDQDGPLHFLVMEYVDGTTLLDIVKKHGPLSVLRAAHYIRQTAIGLDHACQRGMIHRDIKPGNIILDRRGTAKLLDMGLARFYQDEQDQITIKYDDKNVLGTADYVAPEQTRDSRNIDIRADIYGLGASFYFILTGQPPFPDGTVGEKIIAHQTRKPRSVREVRPEVPQGLAKIIDKMMAKEPKDRFQTPQEIVDALETWAAEPIDPPMADEMPKLSPAALAGQHFGNPAPAAAAQSRDSSHVRPEEIAPHRSMSSSSLALPEVVEAAFESAMTIPVPPAARSGQSGPTSVVDLVAPLLPKPAAAPPKPAIVASGETRSISAPSQPTPPHLNVRPTMPPPARLAPPAPPTPPPPIRPVQAAASPPRPLQPPPPPAPPQPPPAPPAAPFLPETKKIPGGVAGLTPTHVPGFDTKRPSKSDVPVAPPPKSPSFDFPKPPSLPDFPKPASKHGLSRTPGLPQPQDTAAPPADPFASPFPDASALPPPPPVPERKLIGSWNLRLSKSKNKQLEPQAPTYRAPTLMPFFDQPGMVRRPSILARFLRMVFMLVISCLLGATIGVAVWSQYLRQ